MNDKPGVPAPEARLVSFKITGMLCRGHNMDSIGVIQVENPHPAMRDWSISIRGERVYVVSPRGWALGLNSNQWSTNGPRKVFPIAISECRMEWEGDVDAVSKLMVRYDSGPLRAIGPAKDGDL